MIHLGWKPDQDGWRFQLVEDDKPIPTDAWALYQERLSETERAALARLQLLEETEAVEPGREQVLLRHASVANLRRSEADQLGLPRDCPYRIEVSTRGNLFSEEFSVGYRWTHERRPVPVERSGSRLSTETEQFLLRDPEFSLLEALDSFPHSGSADDRLRAWAHARKFCSDRVDLDPYLREVEVLEAETLTIGFERNESGELHIVPLMGTRRLVEDEERGGFRAEVQAVAEDVSEQARINTRFRRRSPDRYSLKGAGRWLVPTKEAKALLDVAWKKNQAAEPEKRSFIRNPRAHFRQELPDLSSEELDLLVIDLSEFSDRVQGVKVWEGVAQGPTGPTGADDWGFELSGPSLDGASSSPRPPAPTTTRVALDVKENLEGELYEATPAQGEAHLELLEGLLRSDLYPHQRQAFQWLVDTWASSASKGCLLADDMGLGKTLQTLAFMAVYRDHYGDPDPESAVPGDEEIESTETEAGPILVVAPTGLLKNWEDEARLHLEPRSLGPPLRAFGSHLGALRADPSDRRRETHTETGDSLLQLDRLSRESWVLTTYETLRDYQFSFGRVRWGLVVFDEIQKIKNPTAMMTTAAKALQAQMFVGLSGTPVENRPSDLWCVVDSCYPGALRTLKEFTQTYVRPEGGLEMLRRRLLESHDAGPAIVLRRLKRDHLTGLPSKTEQQVERTMPSAQVAAYDAALGRARALRQDNGSGSGSVLAALQAIRLASLHPACVAESGSLARLSDEDLVSRSARMKVLVETLDEVAAAGEKALIFVEHLEFQSILAGLLQRRYQLDSLPLCISGQVNGATRKARVDRFQRQHGFGVMLLTPRAGGVGLTLTAANHVIHLSRWWNPAIEAQCTDRVYRIGQSRPVRVVIPLAVHPELGHSSFDLRLHQLLERKKKIFEDLMMPEDPTADEKWFLTGLDDQGASVS